MQIKETICVSFLGCVESPPLEDEGGYVLVVRDQGGGFPADYDAESSAGLGMKVLKALVGQLGVSSGWRPTPPAGSLTSQ
jgi:hypothetical protein